MSSKPSSATVSWPRIFCMGLTLLSILTDDGAITVNEADYVVIGDDGQITIE